MGFTIDIEGSLNKRLDEMTEEVKRVLQDELNAFGFDTVAMAKNLAPVDMGTLRNLIGFTPLSAEIGILLYAAASYSSYIEFGTGRYAALYVPTLDPEIQAYAREFFINGKGWIPPHPYLFPAIEAQRLELLQRLKANLG